MQVNGDSSYFGQPYLQIRNWIFLKLRKQQRFELPVFFEPGKAKSPGLKVFPPSMQLLNRLLENLRRNLTQSWKFLFSSWQVIKLIDFAWKL
jgi:hypothetical protein